MAKTRIVSPGIPNHKLYRNLKLNGNYISNDGGDEGITIQDDGDMVLNSSGTSTLFLKDAGGEYLSGDGTDLTIASGNDITLEAEDDIHVNSKEYWFAESGLSFKFTPSTFPLGYLWLSKVNEYTTGIFSVSKGLHLDYDVTGIIPDGETHANIVLDLDFTSNSITTVGTINNTGIDMDMIGHSSGTQKNVGIDIAVSGADTNYALITSGGNVGIGVSDPASPLEIFSTSSQLKLSYDASNYADISVADDGHLELATTGTDGDITLDSASAIMLETTSLYVYPSAASTNSLIFSSSPPKLTINSADDAGDEFSVQVNAEGATTISTVDADTAAAHLTIVADGHVKFDGCGVGFDQEEETFSHDPLKNTGGTHDTQIDFRIGNKIYLQMTAAMDQMNLIFPAVSGNFLLHIWYDGDWAVGDWKVWESDLSEATNADVLWPGGTQPDNTASGKDVFSFYWDAETQICYGVASLAFAVPS